MDGKKYYALQRHTGLDYEDEPFLTFGEHEGDAALAALRKCGWSGEPFGGYRTVSLQEREIAADGSDCCASVLGERDSSDYIVSTEIDSDDALYRTINDIVSNGDDEGWPGEEAETERAILECARDNHGAVFGWCGGKDYGTYWDFVRALGHALDAEGLM